MSEIDQAVFYTAPTMGYTIIGKSRGITDDEENTISGKSLPTEYLALRDVPTENLKRGAGGGFFRVFSLPTGRVAVCHVVYKGTDEFGRDVMNAHSLVLSKNQYSELHANPYLLIHLFSHPTKEGALPTIALETAKRGISPKYPDSFSHEYKTIVDLLLKAAQDEKVFLILPDDYPADDTINKALSLVPRIFRLKIYLYSFASDPERTDDFNFIVVPKAIEKHTFFVDGLKERLSPDYKPELDYTQYLSVIFSKNAVKEFMDFIDKNLLEPDVHKLNNLSEYYLKFLEWQEIPDSDILRKLTSLVELLNVAEKSSLSSSEIYRLESALIESLRRVNIVPDNAYEPIISIVTKRHNFDLLNVILPKLETESSKVDLIKRFYDKIQFDVKLRTIKDLDAANVRAILSFLDEKGLHHEIEVILEKYQNEDLTYEYLKKRIERKIPISTALLSLIKSDDYKKSLIMSALESNLDDIAIKILQTLPPTMLEDMSPILKEFAVRSIKAKNLQRVEQLTQFVTRDTDILEIIDNLIDSKDLEYIQFAERMLERVSKDDAIPLISRIADIYYNYGSQKKMRHYIDKAIRYIHELNDEQKAYKYAKAALSKGDKDTAKELIDIISDPNLLAELFKETLEKQYFSIVKSIGGRLPDTELTELSSEIKNKILNLIKAKKLQDAKELFSFLTVKEDAYEVINTLVVQKDINFISLAEYLLESEGLKDAQTIKKLAEGYYRYGIDKKVDSYVEKAISYILSTKDEDSIYELTRKMLEDKKEAYAISLIDHIQDKSKLSNLLKVALKYRYSDLIQSIVNKLSEVELATLSDDLTKYILNMIDKRKTADVVRFIKYTAENDKKKILSKLLDKDELDYASTLLEEVSDVGVLKKAVKKYHEHGKKRNNFKLLEQAITLARKLNDTKEEMDILSTMYDRGFFTKHISPDALPYLKQYLNQLKSTNKKKYSEVLRNLIKQGNEQLLEIAMEELNSIDNLKDFSKVVDELIDKAYKVFHLETYVEKKALMGVPKEEKIKAFSKFLQGKYPKFDNLKNFVESLLSVKK